MPKNILKTKITADQLQIKKEDPDFKNLHKQIFLGKLSYKEIKN